MIWPWVLCTWGYLMVLLSAQLVYRPRGAKRRGVNPAASLLLAAWLTTATWTTTRFIVLTVRSSR